MRVRRTPLQTLKMLGLALVRSAVTALIVVAFLSVALRLYLDRGWEAVTPEGTFRAEPTEEQRFQTIQHLDRLEAALEVFRLRHGRYVLALEELVHDGLVPAHDLTFPGYAQPYYYRQAGDSYVLYPPRY